MMKVVILCGGKGTRLREETEFRPKPLMEIGGKPILWHIMKIYAHFGFTRFVLCLGYRGNMIKDYFLNYAARASDFTINLGNHGAAVKHHNDHGERDFQVTLADTGLETLTGGRLKRVEPYIQERTFMMTYGDGLADINLKELERFHTSHGKVATVTAVRPFSRFGGLELAADGTVFRFWEKAQVEEWISGGFFVFDRRIFDYLDEDEPLEQAPLRRLAEDSELVAYRHEGFWYAMDTYREYAFLNEMWAKGKAPWKLWEREQPQITGKIVASL